MYIFFGVWQSWLNFRIICSTIYLCTVRPSSNHWFSVTKLKNSKKTATYVCPNSLRREFLNYTIPRKLLRQHHPSSLLIYNNALREISKCREVKAKFCQKRIRDNWASYWLEIWPHHFCSSPWSSPPTPTLCIVAANNVPKWQKNIIRQQRNKKYSLFIINKYFSTNFCLWKRKHNGD
jgi:hypothetical protein